MFTELNIQRSLNSGLQISKPADTWDIRTSYFVDKLTGAIGFESLWPVSLIHAIVANKNVFMAIRPNFREPV